MIILLEGPQSDRHFDNHYLAGYNVQIKGLVVLGELKCPACEFSFFVDDFYDSDTGDNSGDDATVDNALENERNELEGDGQDLEETAQTTTRKKR
ncbi:hypothetical protein DVH05_022086 [Phytophthora capsici]|nr:hypothetical protein DVH05_022086 [Phytophthora capsici]